VGAENAHETGLAGRYATAMFELAQDDKSVDAVAADFSAIKAAIQSSPDLARLVRSPAFSETDQTNGLKAVLTKMGVAPLTLKFVQLLAAKRRLFALIQAITAYEHQVAKSRGETEAEVTSARALSASEITELTAALKAKLGKEPRLHAKTDPSLLGGLVVKVGSRMIDSSLRTKLDGLRAAMKGN